MGHESFYSAPRSQVTPETPTNAYDWKFSSSVPGVQTS